MSCYIPFKVLIIGDSAAKIVEAIITAAIMRAVITATYRMNLDILGLFPPTWGIGWLDSLILNEDKNRVNTATRKKM